MSFEKWCAANGHDIAAMDRAENQHYQALWRKEMRATDTAFGGGVEAIVAKARLDHAGADSEARARLETEILRCEEAGLGAQETALAMIRADRSIYRGPRVETGRAPGSGEVIATALALAHGVSESSLEKSGVPGPVLEAARHPSVRGIGLHGIMRMILNQAGVPAPQRFGDSSIREVFHLSSIGPSSLSLPGILSNMANKSALAAFMEVGTTWQKWCKRSTDLVDFKPHNRYRLTGEGAFEELAPGGQLKHASLSEESYELSADTFGKLLGIDRRDLINDDMGILETGPKILGRMAAVFVERAVYKLLLSNAGSFFSSGNGNYDDGAGDTLLDLTGIANAYRMFSEQTDSNGDPTMIPAKILLVPSALEPAALSLVGSLALVGGTTAQPDANIWRGRFECVSSPYLGTACGLSGASDKQWYLLTGPSDFSVVEVGFIGSDRPTVESGEMDFDRLGLALRAYFDFGCAFAEYRGGVAMKGEN